jgi:hypothetical protein
VWVNQGEAAERLTAEGDIVSRSALVRYLQKHPEIPTQKRGKGEPVFVDFAALKAHRADLAARKQDEPPQTAKPAEAKVVAFDEVQGRSRNARVEKEESDARLARVRADEAEGRVVAKADALAAFTAIGAVLVQGFDGSRRRICQRIRGADDQRQAEIVMREEEGLLRALVVRELGALMQPPADAPAAAAE